MPNDTEAKQNRAAAHFESGMRNALASEIRGWEGVILAIRQEVRLMVSELENGERRLADLQRRSDLLK